MALSRVVLFILVMCLPSIAFAETVYIDPTCAVDDDGTVGEPCASGIGKVGPRNSWKNIVWYGGISYLGKGGTSETLSNYLAGGSGTPGSLITIGSYGTTS